MPLFSSWMVDSCVNVYTPEDSCRPISCTPSSCMYTWNCAWCEVWKRQRFRTNGVTEVEEQATFAASLSHASICTEWTLHACAQEKSCSIQASASPCSCCSWCWTPSPPSPAFLLRTRDCVNSACVRWIGFSCVVVVYLLHVNVGVYIQYSSINGSTRCRRTSAETNECCLPSSRGGCAQFSHGPICA